MEKVLLDTDIGGDIDDAICLAYLLSEPRCDLLGITTVSGKAELRAKVADAICKAAGREIQIVAGLDTTLQSVSAEPVPEGAKALTRWKHQSFSKGNAVDFLYQKIREFPHEVILIGIGNMTNIATLFRNYPDSQHLLKGLYVMNGYFGTEPLPELWYNWNSWADPLASQIVFSSKPVVHRAISLDVTNGLTIEAEQAKLIFSSDTELLKAVFDFGNNWLERTGELTLHDPLTDVCVFYPDLCRFERGFVGVETRKAEKMGETTFSACPDGTVEIAKDVKKELFYHILSSVITRR